MSNGDDFFCICNTCSENEGNCNAHDECQDNLLCGSNNCPDSLSFDSEVDCCYRPIVGEEDFCTTGIPCGEHEGDCDSNSECQSNHFCGSNNCPPSLGFESEVDCCSSTQIMSPYPNNVDETWLVKAPTGSIINLQFHFVNIRILDKLEIFDGSNDLSTPILTLMGSHISFGISSAGNSLYVKLTSNNADVDDGSTGFLATIHYSNHYLNIKQFFKISYYILEVKIQL